MVAAAATSGVTSMPYWPNTHTRIVTSAADNVATVNGG